MRSFGHLNRLVNLHRLTFLQVRQYNTDIRTFKEGDAVILRPVKDPANEGFLTNPLSTGKTIHLHHGAIKQIDVIGKRHRQTVTTSKGVEYQIFEPSLAEYVCLTRRLVTPIYPDNASILVRLLDLHPPYPGEKLEILEAGTGHGSLTLHLAQAIHNSNPPLRLDPSTESAATQDGNENQYTGNHNELTQWKATRGAVIHTLDISAKHSEHARNIIKNFRNGIYFGDIDFHIGDLPNFFDSYHSDRKQFLSHVILDMPSAEERLALASRHLKVDGKLLVFNPSVTQITECVRRVSQEAIPLQLERVIELAGSFSGGREWDVRIAKIKSPKKEGLNTTEDSTPSTKSASILSRFSSLFSQIWLGKSNIAHTVEKNWAVVCRPKAGDRIPVGGFIGLWRRKLDNE